MHNARWLSSVSPRASPQLRTHTQHTRYDHMITSSDCHDARPTERNSKRNGQTGDRPQQATRCSRPRCLVHKPTPAHKRTRKLWVRGRAGRKSTRSDGGSILGVGFAEPLGVKQERRHASPAPQPHAHRLTQQSTLQSRTPRHTRSSSAVCLARSCIHAHAASQERPGRAAAQGHTRASTCWLAHAGWRVHVRDKGQGARCLDSGREIALRVRQRRLCCAQHWCGA